ncbi:MAG: 2'-5' RNA ligase family protein [Kiritimatiellae bacterium]|nr:2'-5' RNA ligase family protein [Kiritimatiellia bacterium]
MNTDGEASQLGRFAVWLMPGSEERAKLARIIRDLAARHDVPAFDPHVTLFEGHRTAADQVERIVTAVVARADAFPLQATGLDHSADLFKTVFITFRRDPFLERLSRAIGQRLARPQQYNLQPHLSLVYKEMADEERKGVIAALEPPRPRILFDEVAVVNPGPTGEWRDVANWEVEFSLLLGAPGS